MPVSELRMARRGSVPPVPEQFPYKRQVLTRGHGGDSGKVPGFADAGGVPGAARALRPAFGIELPAAAQQGGRQAESSARSVSITSFKNISGKTATTYN